MGNILVGLDPGIKTGVAIANNGELLVLKTFYLKQTNLFDIFDFIQKANPDKIILEDSSLVSNLWNNGNSVGKNQMLSRIFKDFALYHNIKIECVNPMIRKRGYSTKLSKTQFEKLTGWNKKSSEHSRDAAMLIWRQRL